MAYDKERMIAVQAVLQASELCRSVQRALTKSDAAAKDDRSPVTVADFGSQAIVSRILANAFPDDPLVAEEDSAEFQKTGNEAIRRRVATEVVHLMPVMNDAAIVRALDRGGHAGGGGRFWTLDPIDGTKGFLRGEQYAVALALIEGGEVVLGVLGCPNLQRFDFAGEADGRLFIAVKGEGAFERGFGEDRTEWKIHVDNLDDPAKAAFTESVESGHSSHSGAAEVATELGITAPPLRMDSQCKYGVVARGERSIYLRLPTTKDASKRHVELIWDHAAGAIIVSEAGGKVTDITGKALDFSQGRRLERNVGVLVTNGRIHDRVLKAVQIAGARP